MNNGQLKSKIINWSTRDDLAPVAQEFVNGATERINRRFGLGLSPMQVDTDTNLVLAEHGHTLYFYAAMRELSLHIKDMKEASDYEALFNIEASRMNIHFRSDNWKTDATEMTYTRSEKETAAILETANSDD